MGSQKAWKTLQIYKGIEKDYSMVDNNEKSPNGPGNDPDTKTACTTCKHNMFINVSSVVEF